MSLVASIDPPLFPVLMAQLTPLPVVRVILALVGFTQFSFSLHRSWLIFSGVSNLLPMALTELSPLVGLTYTSPSFWENFLAEVGFSKLILGLLRARFAIQGVVTTSSGLLKLFASDSPASPVASVCKVPQYSGT